MLKLLADENFDNMIVRGLFRRNPTLDIVRVLYQKYVDNPTPENYFISLLADYFRTYALTATPKYGV